MTGTPTVNNGLWAAAYYLLLLLMIAVFADYDIQHKRVPNQALASFMPYACLSLPINYLSFEIKSVGGLLGSAILGAVFGGMALMAAALATKGGIGGGDIMLTFLLGLVYGPYGILLILFIAAPSALLFGLIKRLFCGEKAIRLAFVPFILFGCALATLLKFM